MRAPFFDDYSSSFDHPPTPPDLPPGTRLRLRLAMTNAGPHYLPREFEFTLPRALERAAADSVFRPVMVQLFRSPGAPVLGGWSVLRVSVTQTNNPLISLPGVLVRVFRSPRGQNDPVIGEGMTEWRGDLRGEALVAVADLPRFRSGPINVFETTQAVHLEATRDENFTGEVAADGNRQHDQIPDMPDLSPDAISRRSDPPDPNDPALAIAPPAPLILSAGHEIAVHLTMP